MRRQVRFRIPVTAVKQPGRQSTRRQVDARAVGRVALSAYGLNGSPTTAVRFLCVMTCAVLVSSSTTVAVAAAVSTVSGDTRVSTFSSFLGGSGDVIYAFDDTKVGDEIDIQAIGPASATMQATGLWNVCNTSALSLSGSGAILGGIQDRTNHSTSWTFTANSDLSISVAAKVDSVDPSIGSIHPVETTLQLAFLDETTGASLHNQTQRHHDTEIISFTDGFALDLVGGHTYRLTVFTRIHDWRGANESGTMSDSLEVAFTRLVPPPSDVIFVDQNACGPNHDGSSWCSAFIHLQDALAVALTGTTIKVADGTYRPDQGAGQVAGDRAATFQLLNGVVLEGGYGGCGADRPELRNLTSTASVLTGDYNGDDLTGFVNYGENALHVVDGSSTDATATIDGFTIQNGYGQVSGFRGGGGVFIVAGSPTVRFCNIRANLGAWGGGISVDVGNPLIVDCTLEGNRSMAWGGGVFTESGSLPRLSRCVLRANKATLGGAVAVFNSSTTLDNCLIQGNTAGRAGGAAYIGGGTIIWTNCTLVGNTATNQSGVLECGEADNPNFRNCVIWGNTAPLFHGIEPACRTRIVNCDVQDLSTLQGVVSSIDADPKFESALGLDGLPGTFDEVFRLSVGSPCIDTGNNGLVVVGADLEGTTRILDGNADTAAIVDMGAYEFQNSCNTDSDCDDGNGCTQDSCVPAIGCVVVPDVSNSCDDGDFCNGIEACDVSGICRRTFVADCNANLIEDACDLAGPAGTALRFDGTGDLVIVPENFELRGGANGSISVETWIWVEDDVNIHSFVTKFAGGCSKTWGFEKHGTAGLAFETEHDCNNYIRFGGIVPVQTWTHVAFTFDGQSNTVVLYVNGDVVGVAASDPLFSTNVDVLFGRRYIFDPLAFSLIGMLDEIRIWSDVRSQEEIQTNMLTRLSGNEEGLLGYWPLDEGQGQQAFDMSPFQNHGMLGTDASDLGDEFDPQWVPSGVPLNGNGLSLDCNANGIPDGCEVDCNGNAVPDECDIANQTSPDFNNNKVPDECDVIVVDSLADPGVAGDGLTTLREAITAANNGGGYTITFDQALAGGTIQPTSQLPAITGGHITIDGDIDHAGVPNIEIDGVVAGAANGIIVSSSQNTINGLIINRFEEAGIRVAGLVSQFNSITSGFIGVDVSGTSDVGNQIGMVVSGGATSTSILGNVVSGNLAEGILIDRAHSSVIIGNKIGTDASGIQQLGNVGTAIAVRNGAVGTRIGGAGPAEPNVISASTGPGAAGIAVFGVGTSSTVVEGNLIGTDVTGTTAIPNSGIGIAVFAEAAATVIRANVVSGNSAEGILLDNSQDSVVEDNKVGTDISGIQAIGNHGTGIVLRNGAIRNTIGPGNTVSGNAGWGVVITDSGTTANDIQSNMIGTDSDGSAAIPNGGPGVAIVAGASANTIGPGNTVSGNSCEGILIDAAFDNVVRENKVGTDASGASSLANQCTGVLIRNASTGNIVGPGNVVSGNTFFGVLISGAKTSANTVHGNRIGTDSTGSVAVANGAPGVMLTNDTTGNIIGPGNVISGNNSEGLVLEKGAHQNTVIGNKCGTNITGSFAIPNFYSGILIQFGGHDNIIGGSGVGESNLCSGNRANGITVRDAGSDYNQILGNYFGTNAFGDAPIPNGTDGVQVNGSASNNTIGPGNVVAWNTAHGVRIDNSGSLGNEVTANSIFNNVWLGIRLRDGGNGLLAAPKIETLTETTVSGTSDAPDGSVVELFSDGFNEGQTFLGSTVVQSGVFEFGGVVPAAGFVTATVTDPNGNTSTFGRFGDEPGTRLFGIVTNFGAVQTRGSLVSLDPFGETSIVGNLGLDSPLDSFIRGGFAHRPDGELHLLNEGGNLYQVDPRTGMATLTGNLGYPEVEASAFSSDGFLYVAAADVVDSQAGDNIISLDTLVRVHPNSMSATVIGNIGTDIDAMTFLPTGELVGIDTDVDKNGDVFSNVYLIDSATGTGTFVQSLPGFNIVSLAYQDGKLLGLDGRGGLVSLDPISWRANMLVVLKYLTRALAAGPPPPLAFGDFSGDGHTDLTDYAVFKTCFLFSGPGTEPPFQECLDHFDWNDDGDVDLRDAGIFQRAFMAAP